MPQVRRGSIRSRGGWCGWWCWLPLLASCGPGFPVDLSDDLGFSALVFLQQSPPANAGALAWQRPAPAPGRLMWLEPAALGGQVEQLLGGEGVALEAVAVAPDASALVFAARLDGADRFHLYRLDIEAWRRGEPCIEAGGDLGAACRRLTFGPADDLGARFVRPAGVVFQRLAVETSIDFQGRGAAWHLYYCDSDGSGLRPLEVLPGQVRAPVLRPDGWLQAVRWTERQGQAQWLPVLIDPGSVSGVLPAGAPLEQVPLAGVTSAGQVVATCTAPLGTWGAGTPCRLAADGSWTLLVDAIAAGAGCSAAGRVRDSWPLTDGRLLVSSAELAQGCLNSSDGDQGRRPVFSLAVLRPDDGQRQPLYNQPEWANVMPRPVMERTLPDWPSGQVPAACSQPRVEVSGFVRDHEGRLLAEATRVRLYRALDGASVPWRVEPGGRRPAVIGGSAGRFQAPIYADGSFYLLAPAAAPWRLAALDAYGAVLERDPLWRAAPGCAQRSCSGCHAGATTTGTGAALARNGPASDLGDPTGAWSIDFRRDIQPVLQRSCAVAGCHDSTTAAGSYVDLNGNLRGLDLTGVAEGRATRAYRNLLWLDVRRDSRSGRILESRRPYVEPGWARRSRLIQKLGVPCRFDCSGRPAWAEWALGPGRQHPEDQPGHFLSDDERWLLVDWIDSGAAFLGEGVGP